MAAATDLLQEVSISSATTLDSPGYTIGDTSITVVSVSTWPTATGITFAMDEVDAAGVQVAGTYNEYVGVKASATSITNVSHQNGTNQNYTAGATTRVYIPVSAERENRIVEWGLTEHEQDGTHAVELITSRTEDTNPDPDADFLLTYDTSATALKKVKPSNLSGGLTGWTSNVLPSVSSVTNNGNRSYDVVFSSTVASYLTPGMRVRTSRTVAAPTYMGGAFNGSNHYFTKVTCTSTLSTVTNNFTFMTYYMPTSYALGQIGGRSDAASNNAMSLSMEADGRVSVSVFNGGVANYRQVSTYQSLPLNKKTHIAASWTGGTVVIYFDGVSVPVATATTGGTAPTTAGTGGDFSIGRKGAYNANYAVGYISGFGVFDAVLTASTIKSYIGQVLSGSETNCIGAWSLNNTAVNQQAAGTNDLTATNSVGYTSGTSPYSTDANGVAGGTYDFGIVTKVATTTATVQVPEGCTIPTSGGVSAVDLSSVKSPFGFPAQRGRWSIKSFINAQVSLGTTSNTYYADNVLRLEIPIGSWKADYLYRHISSRGAASDYRVLKAILSTTAATETDVSWSSLMQWGVFTATDSQATVEHQKHGYIDLSSQTIHYAGVAEGQTIATQTLAAGSHINAECAYL